MVLAQKRVGVVVVDMQASPPRSRWTVFIKDCMAEELQKAMEVERKATTLHSGADGFFSTPGGRPLEKFLQHRNLPQEEAGRLDVFLHSRDSELALSDALGRKIKVAQAKWVFEKKLEIGYPDEWADRVYSRVESLLSEADRLGLPIAILEYRKWGNDYGPPTDERILKAAGKDAKIFKKKTRDGLTDNEFMDFLGEVDIVVLAGYDKAVCVYETAASMLEAGIGIMTSGAVLFGNEDCNSKNEHASRFYREKTEFYRTLDELLAAIRKKVSLY